MVAARGAKMPVISYDALRDLTLKAALALGCPAGEAEVVAEALARANLVAPFGGSAGRLATNPIAFACPGPERPILVDITTSVVAEGKVRVYRNSGKQVPEGWIVDNQGNPSTDPNDLYTSPRGAILP